MDTYSLNVNIEEEVKSYGVEDKLNDYIAVQKQVIPILEKENFYGYVKNETTGVEIDIGKKGIKETLGSGKRFQTLPRIIKMLKIATLRSMPEIIVHARVLEDDAINVHGGDERFAYLGIDVSINGVLFKITIDIKKTKEKNKFWMHNIRITEKNSQLLSPAQCQDVHEIGNPCNHIIAQKNENASENLNVAYLSNKDDFTIFEFREHVIRFCTSKKLEYYVEVKEWDNGYLVVMAKYEENTELEEEYIDLIPILENLYFNVEEFLNQIEKVTVRNETEGGI